MCGITGFIDLDRNLNSTQRRDAITGMTDRLTHRGPDDSGTWEDPHSGATLGHRRLSIVDLTQEGHQPMISSSGNQILVFNGEIYNHHEIRNELQKLGVSFRGLSDTEVMLSAFQQWGCAQALDRLLGMFAFALWDKDSKELFLGRDRMGEKPLYYGWVDRSFVFASELKAVTRFPGWKHDIDRNALTLLMRYNCIPAPYSIYRNMKKLQPGFLLRLKCNQPHPEEALSKYWSLEKVAEAGIAHPLPYSESQAISELDQILKNVVAEEMVTDVPLGAFLSGGVDSSMIVALMQAQSSRPIQTYTIGFNEESFDEAKYAHAVAQHLGTQHTELYISPKEALAVVPKLAEIYDEPFADSSQIPTYLVAQLARKTVTVALSGDGGDEVFAGYSRHFVGTALWYQLQKLPIGLRTKAAAFLDHMPFEKVSRLVAGAESGGKFATKLDKLIHCLEAENAGDLYMGLVSHMHDPADFVIGGSEPALFEERVNFINKAYEPLFAMQYLDSVGYLPDDILTKVDRATMAVSLECRAPFLDRRVVEFAWKLPASMKVREKSGKWILKKLLARYVPLELFDRPKSGFAIPLHIWLKGPLREWAEALLNEQRLKSEGYFNAAKVRAAWEDYLSGRRSTHYQIWNILMFQAWKEHAW
jgi:asparagine synthase (glutamine-hydrolysing)